MKVPASIINSLNAWNDGAEISLSDWILCVGNYEHFVAYSRLVWPDFIEYENKIYIADFLMQTILQGTSITAQMNIKRNVFKIA